MTEYDPQLVERMVALVRKMAEACDDGDHDSGPIFLNDNEDEARAVIAELLAPVGADLRLARDLAASVLDDLGPVSYGWARMEDMRAGGWDSSLAVQKIFAAIKRVRAQTGNG